MALLLAVLPNALCGAAVAGVLAMLFTAPRQYLVPAFLCGLAALLTRDVLTASGMNVNWATALAAAVAVVAAVTVTPKHAVVPVVLIAAILPLGAAVAVFQMMVQLMRVASVTGPPLTDATVNLTASIGKAFTAFVAIALGLQFGIAIVQPLQRRRQQ